MNFRVKTDTEIRRKYRKRQKGQTIFIICEFRTLSNWMQNIYTINLFNNVKWTLNNNLDRMNSRYSDISPILSTLGTKYLILPSLSCYHQLFFVISILILIVVLTYENFNCRMNYFKWIRLVLLAIEWLAVTTIKDVSSLYFNNLDVNN